MNLLIDVGNTQTEVGIFDQDKKLETWRFSSKLFNTEDEIATLIRNFFRFKSYEFKQIDHIAISSVVPENSFILKRFGIKYFNLEPLFVDYKLKLPIEISYEPKSHVGADRICGAVAAYNEYKENIIVIDFGTATTMDVVKKTGVYIGGIITLGIEGVINTLHRNAAKLPMVTLEVPAKFVGNSTESSIRSGVFLGQIQMVNGLINEIIKEQSFDSVKVITTGGLASIINPHINFNVIHNPDLILIGLNSILKSNL